MGSTAPNPTSDTSKCRNPGSPRCFHVKSAAHEPPLADVHALGSHTARCTSSETHACQALLRHFLLGTLDVSGGGMIGPERIFGERSGGNCRKHFFFSRAPLVGSSVLVQSRMIHTGLTIALLPMARDVSVGKRILPHHGSYRGHRRCRILYDGRDGLCTIGNVTAAGRLLIGNHRR